GYRIMYNDRFVKPTMLVTMDVAGTPLEQVLDQLLAPNKLTYHIEKKTIAISRKAEKDRPAKLSSGPSLIQDRLIRGKVTDESGNPLQGVTVREKESGRITNTDVNGEYRINL